MEVEGGADLLRQGEDHLQEGDRLWAGGGHPHQGEGVTAGGEVLQGDLEIHLQDHHGVDLEVQQNVGDIRRLVVQILLANHHWRFVLLLNEGHRSWLHS